jgi:hypothetical protein
MSPSLRALAWFAAWTLVLAFVMVNHRVYFVLTGQRKINSFAPDGSGVSAFQARACRAHANCYENLPVFAALLLAAVAAGRSAITDPLAMIAVYARMAQSTVHLLSVSQIAVAIRATFYTVQMAIMVWWAWRLLAG